MNKKFLDKEEYCKKYFTLLQQNGKLLLPPYTYSYIMSNDSIQVVEKQGAFGFAMYPQYKRFILPSYSENDGFNNKNCIYAFPSLDKTKGRQITTQFILHRDYTLLNYKKLGEGIQGVGKPIQYNQVLFDTLLNNKLIRKYDACVFTKDVGQHFFLYEIDEFKVIIVWDDYFSSSINIIALSQVVRTEKGRYGFNHPYSILEIYINALCSFFRMFPSGTLFNTTLEPMIGVAECIVYVSLNPIACFDIYARGIRGTINEEIRMYPKYNKKKWLKNDKNLFTKSIYNPKFNRKKRAEYSNKKSEKEKKAVVKKWREEHRKPKQPKPKKRKVKKKKKIDNIYTRKIHRHIRKSRKKKEI